MSWSTCNLLKHENLFSKYVIIARDRKIGFKQDGKNFIGGLDRSTNDTCIGAFDIQKHVCNYIDIAFPLVVVGDDSEELRWV
jgi:hypothetical protein